MTDTTPDDDDEWNPEPATLREGETTDLSAHARGNIEQIREGVRDGILSEADAESAIESITEKDQ